MHNNPSVAHPFGIVTTRFRARLSTNLLSFVLASATALAQQADSQHAETAVPTGQSLQHWSLQPVTRQAIPATEHTHPIDAFVQAELDRQGLTLSPPADPATLVRRLYLIMLGVPPTPAAVAALVADPSPKAYERLVDEVLADPRYGERWARHWLDVVRFAESNGFETNRERPNAWRYRDYVIEAFHHDLPYDQFVREQLAGDALGNDIATGFLVAGPVDIVGSPDPVLTAQQRANELDDMVATTGTAFLGLTIGCARCHSHKFDPISHREYHALTAMFAGVKHGERALPLSSEQAQQLTQLDAQIATLEHQLAPFRLQPPPVAATATRPPVDFAHNEERFQKTTTKLLRFTIFATSGGEPCIDELEVWSGDRNVALASNGTVATASGTLRGYDIHQLLHVHDGELGNSHSWISDEVGGGWLQLEFAEPVCIDRIVWARDRNGVVRDRLAVQYQIEAKSPAGDWQVLASSSDREPFGQTTAPYRGSVYRFEQLGPAEADALQHKLAQRQALQQQRTVLAQAPMAYAGTFQQPGPTHLLRRGDAMQPAEQVLPGTLALFAPIELAADTPEQQRRLQLANWITDPSHPTTWRVVVNRIWQHQFGTGLVSTPSDFGNNGAAPSHPALLDWLASDFVEHDWDLRHLLKQVVLSATYRQKSDITSGDLATQDPGNTLLYHYPPARLTAEMLRDNALAISGLLVDKVGGPSVKPYDLAAAFKPSTPDKGEALYRRSVYTYMRQTSPSPLMTTLNASKRDICQVKIERTDSPLQGLVMLNAPQFVEAARTLATRLVETHGNDDKAIIDAAFRRTTSRFPDEAERAVLGKLLTEELAHYTALPAEATKLISMGDSPAPPHRRGPAHRRRHHPDLDSAQLRRVHFQTLILSINHAMP